MGLTEHRDLAQRSEAWYELRRGIVTASAVDSLISVSAPDALTVACPKCGAQPLGQCVSLARKVPTALKAVHSERTAAASDLPPVYAPANNDTAHALIARLAAERVSGFIEDTWTSHDMERGIVAEPFARDLYSENFAPVVECGFMVREFDGFKLGYSPDGLVGDDGLIEIKAPRAKTHLTTVVDGEVPAHYMAQLQTGLLVSGRAWIDFVSYSGGMHLWRHRVTPDPRWQTAIREAVEQAEHAIADLTDKYLSAVVGLPATERINNDLGLVF